MSPEKGRVLVVDDEPNARQRERHRRGAHRLGDEISEIPLGVQTKLLRFFQVCSAEASRSALSRNGQTHAEHRARGGILDPEAPAVREGDELAER